MKRGALFLEQMDSPKIGDCGNGLMAGWARPNRLTSATLGLGTQSHPRIQEAPLWAGRERGSGAGSYPWETQDPLLSERLFCFGS